ncbi:MAG TPA: hypothetical protein HPP87_13110 [Planctomycetes bacterium]|nr:hypothetical protein [Planctomycetota bacterium]
MAQLSVENRDNIHKEFMLQTSARFEELGALTKPDLKAAVDAIDEWVENNFASFNSAVPQMAREALSAKQKAQLLFMILKKRWEVS